jgi:hypothetical protein
LSSLLFSALLWPFPPLLLPTSVLPTSAFQLSILLEV